MKRIEQFVQAGNGSVVDLLKYLADSASVQTSVVEQEVDVPEINNLLNEFNAALKAHHFEEAIDVADTAKICYPNFSYLFVLTSNLNDHISVDGKSKHTCLHP